MPKKRILLAILLNLFCGLLLSAQELKPRVLVLTDIENEPDDAMSLVRFLLYANQFNVRGLVATTSIHQPDKVAEWRIREILDACQKVYPILSKHESGYPTFQELSAKVRSAQPRYGLNAVGQEQDSPGSDLIINELKISEEPLWVLAWGGSNCLAQSLYKMRETMSKTELERQISKLRVYTISDQDNSGPWIRRNFPGVFYIVSPGTWVENHDGYFYSTWAGISGEGHYGFATGADTSLVNNAWVDSNIQHGQSALGNQYPDIEYIMEGDSPSFMYLIQNGLNSPENPSFGGWGGRYELYLPKTEKWFWEDETRPIWTNAIDKVAGNDGRFYADNRATIWRWREAFQNDFRARMDWTFKDYSSANHPPLVEVDNEENITLKAGEAIQVSAKGSSDPDGDKLRFDWQIYYEAGSTFRKALLENTDASTVKFTAPTVSKTENYHLILSVTDNGTPELTRYKRLIIEVNP